MSEQKDVSTDYQTCAEELEQLVRDLLAEIKEVAPFAYATTPRMHALQDRAAALGIVLELKR